MGKRGDDQHRYGRHYTPVEVARLLAAFAVRREQDLVFDPSCGDGRLLAEALKLKGSHRKEELFGIDRLPQTGGAAASEHFKVACADFFDLEPGASLENSFSLPARFDAIIGNPPYIRQEVMGVRDKERIAKCLNRDRASSPEIFWPRWSRRSDIYVYFFAHSARFLARGGRLVFLTAGSWMDSGYGVALREFLLRNFRVVAVIESFVESFFLDASINTVITVLEMEPESTARDENWVRFVRLTAPVQTTLGSSDGAREFAHSIECGVATITNHGYRLRVVNQAELLSQMSGHGARRPSGDASSLSDGWGKHLRADDVFFRILSRGSGKLTQLSDLARVRFGVKTGANDFFYVERNNTTAQSDAVRASASRKRVGVNGRMKRLNEVAAVRRGITTGANAFFYLRVPPRSSNTARTAPARSTAYQDVQDALGVRHLLESRYLSPVVFSLKEVAGILLTDRRTRRLLFNCEAKKSQLVGTMALRYIRKGERAGFHRRPTCASRRQWYSLIRGMKPAPLIFPSKVGERWVVAINRARVFEDKKLYGIFPGSRVSALVLAALLNSTWARYYAEITCRQMTGAQAIADIDVAVAEGIALPDPRRMPQSIKKRLVSALDALSGRPILSIFEEAVRDDRRRLDRLVLLAIGFKAKECETVLDELYQAVLKLVRERREKSRA